MPDDLNASLLKWPWALSTDDEQVRLHDGEVDTPFNGLAVLACAPNIRLIPAGGSADIAPLSCLHDRILYELPQGRAGAAESPLELRSSLPGSHTQWVVGLDGAKCRLEEDDSGGQNESPESVAVFDWWDAFDDLLSLRFGADNAIRWEEVESWLGRQSVSSEPRRALIVEIAEALGFSLLDRASHLRRILFRRRNLVPAHRIQQMDEECLRWYIRQPGETLAEKAGHRQEIMSVVRRETFDTLENRILKDFLLRCARACARYLRRFELDFPSSERVNLVHRFQYTCEQALKLPDLEFVRKPRPGALPNYVLQSDPRYRDIWGWYQKLLHNQDSEEQIWNWQGRLWADVARLLVGSACQLHRRSGTSITSAPLFVEHEGRLGSRLGEHWAPGPFLVRHVLGIERVLSVVDSRHIYKHPIARELAALGAHGFLIEEHFGGERPSDVMAIWALNGMATAHHVSATEVATSLGRVLSEWRSRETISRSVDRLDGIVVLSQLGQESLTLRHLESVGEGASRVGVVQIGSDPRSWQDAVIELAGQLELWL